MSIRNETQEIPSLTRRLISGGDERLNLDEDGLNKYGCAPVPRDVMPLGSCTSSTASLRAWNAAMHYGKLIDESLCCRSPQQVADVHANEIREEITNWLALDELQPEIFLAPSGTDTELLVLALVAEMQSRPLLNIVVGPGEIGSGSRLAAAGLHYASQLASGGRAVPGEPVNVQLARSVEVAEVQLRARDGGAFPQAVVDAEVTSHLEEARRNQRGVILHVVAHSKTGVHAPSLGLVNRIIEDDPNVVVLIDAAQGRFSRRGAKEILKRGCWLLVTGSKFFGGPAFSGALLVPQQCLDARVRGAELPTGIADYFCAADLPVSFARARSKLGDRTNFGLLLRWRAALAEIATYYKADPHARLQVLRHFESELPRILTASPYITLLDESEPLHSNEAERLLESKRTVFSFAVSDDNGRRLGITELKSLVNLLNKDMSDAWPLTLNTEEKLLSSKCFHIGQPVIIGDESYSDPLSVVRVALGGRLISDVATGALPLEGDSLEARLDWMSRQLHDLRRKIDLIARHATVLGM